MKSPDVQPSSLFSESFDDAVEERVINEEYKMEKEHSLPV